MKRKVKSQITWALPKDGGREYVLPIGMRYCPIIVFIGKQDSDSLWSAEIYNTSIDDRVSIAELSYLVDAAPDYLLHTGNEFLLYEGQSVVAKGVVL